MYTSYVGSPSPNSTLKLHHELPLLRMEVRLPTAADTDTEFNVISTARSFTLAAASVQARDEWMSVLNEAIDHYQYNQSSFEIAQNLIPSIELRFGQQVRSLKHPDRLFYWFDSLFPLCLNVFYFALMRAPINSAINFSFLLLRFEICCSICYWTGWCYDITMIIIYYYNLLLLLLILYYDAVVFSQAPIWIPDSRVTMCQLCTAAFTVTFRRHHCRCCGKVSAISFSYPFSFSLLFKRAVKIEPPSYSDSSQQNSKSSGQSPKPKR